MARSEVDIINDVLAQCKASVRLSSFEDINEDTTSADVYRNYKNTIQRALTIRGWTFSIKTVNIAPSLSEEDEKEFTIPTDFLKIVSTGELTDYKIENRVIKAKASNLKLTYISSDIDVNSFSQPFVDYIIYSTALRSAHMFSLDQGEFTRFKFLADQSLTDAVVLDTRQRKQSDEIVTNTSWSDGAE